MQSNEMAEISSISGNEKGVPGPVFSPLCPVFCVVFFVSNLVMSNVVIICALVVRSPPYLMSSPIRTSAHKEGE